MPTPPAQGAWDGPGHAAVNSSSFSNKGPDLLGDIDVLSAGAPRDSGKRLPHAFRCRHLANRKPHLIASK
jgi:hypothetical protein